MPKLILTSKSAIWDKSTNAPYPGVVEALRSAKKEGCTTFVVSNHSRPTWLTGALDFIQFQRCGFKPPRQSGKIVQELIELNRKNGLAESEIIILGADDEDMMMAVNSKTVLIRCEWAKPLGSRIANYGVPFVNPGIIPVVLKLLEGNEPWYFVHSDEFLTVYAATNAGTRFEPDATMVRLVNALRGCLKSGSKELHKGFVLHFLSSVYNTQIFREVDIWSYFPSSGSSNEGAEVMADFCDLARETYKKRSNGPLFIRHKPSIKRHLGKCDRTDPTSQLETVHLNPEYAGKLEGSTVAVLDDYLTYGVSFGVAAALLKKAGASKVVAVAMGKFGNCANLYDIEIKSDNVYQPLSDFRLVSTSQMSGDYEREAQTDFVKKFTDYV